MWTVSPPTISAEEAFGRCNTNLANQDLKSRMEESRTEISQAAALYQAAAQLAGLHQLSANDFLLRRVTSAEMLAAYRDRFAHAKGSARSVYDAIRNAPKYGRCPMCGHRDVTTVDHNLPKSAFPALAVCPMNLIPACAVCNKIKLASVPESAEVEPLHPYFDNVEGDQWLHASVVETIPAAVRFHVAPPATWPTTLHARVVRQFEILKLGNLYAPQAAQEIAGIRRDLRKLFQLAEAEGVRIRLTEAAASRRDAERNHWRTATYQALAASSWFYGGGFDGV